MTGHVSSLLETLLRVLLLALTACASVPSPSAPARSAPPLWGSLTPGEYTPGFRVTPLADPDRPGPGGVRPRTLLASVWYPARAGSTPGMTLRDYAYRMAGLQDGAQASEAQRAEAVRRALAVSAAGEPPAASREALFSLELAAVDAAPAAAGRFPLVLVAQGWSYESPLFHVVLAELLASHGYVVAAVPLMGTLAQAPEVSAADLETQVRDLELLLAHARSWPQVDGARVAVVGFDLGGIAATLLAMQHREVGAVISLDSGILSARLLPELVTSSPRYAPEQLRASLLVATRLRVENEARGLAEDLRLLDAVQGPDIFLLRLGGMRHADFTLFGPVEGVLPAFWGPPPGKPAQLYPLLARRVFSFMEATLCRDANARAKLLAEPQPEAPPGVTVTLQKYEPPKR